MDNRIFSLTTLKYYRWEVCYFLFFTTLFCVFWQSAMTINEHGDLVAGHANLWGDWAVHFTMGSAMAYREFIPSTSPLMLDAAFSYPFTTNLISAGLIRLGVPFYLAFIIPSFIFCMLLTIAVYVFFRIFLKSRHLALFAAALFFFNGGVGIYYFLVDVFNASSPLTTLINPPHEYTNHEPEHIKWISVISSMMFPQRSFALGVGICLIALSLIYYSFRLLEFKNTLPNWKMNVIAGVLLGFLPLLHTHSFLAAFIILGFWCIADLLTTPKESLQQRLLYWGIIIFVTSAIALPIIFTYFIGNVGGHFFKWFPGWYAKEFNINWLLFWFKNWTVVPFLGFAGFAILIAKQGNVQKRWHAALIITPGMLLFIVPNLFLTQPWLWDNTKLFIWSSVFISPMAAYASYHLFKKDGAIVKLYVRIGLWLHNVIRQNQHYILTPIPVNHDKTQETSEEKEEAPHTQQTENIQPPVLEGEGTRHVKLQRYTQASTLKCLNFWGQKARKFSFICICLFMCSSGFLDAYYTARTDLHSFTMYNKRELALAEWVKENTPVDSIWLTSTKHNHWLFNLTGRRALMTYTGWLWTHGYDYRGVEKDAKRLFRTGNRAIIEKYNIDYIIYDRSAKKDMGANLKTLEKNFKLIKILGQYRIYRTQP